MKWKKIGKVLLIDDNLEKEYSNHLEELLAIHNVETIAKIKKISGQLRQPELELLLGDKTETIHKENGCLFKLDLSKIMWSKGNTTERMRIAQLVEDGEIVVDMFAGIGYFSIPIAVHSNPTKLIAIELNPVSHSYLQENIAINKIATGNVIAMLGDSGEIVPTLAKDITADRVIMGYVKTTHHYLEAAIALLKKGGILHYHETVPEKLLEERPIARIKEAAAPREVELLAMNVIKKYSPGVVHAVIDVRIS
jgi:tRNA wybutosine-synthesizing protein 2